MSVNPPVGTPPTPGRGIGGIRQITKKRRFLRRQSKNPFPLFPWILGCFLRYRTPVLGPFRRFECVLACFGGVLGVLGARAVVFIPGCLSLSLSPWLSLALPRSRLPLSLTSLAYLSLSLSHADRHRHTQTFRLKYVHILGKLCNNIV